MINWDDLKFCLAVHRHGSMLNAGKSLHANVATVSRRLERITKDIGQTIFIRNGQEWQATPIGNELVDLARDIEGRISPMVSQTNQPLPKGAVIKLSISVTIMQTYMKHIVASHDSDKIGYNVDLSIHDRSLAYSESDVAVRYTRPTQGNYICSRITDVELRPYISSEADSFPTDWLEIDYDGLQFEPSDFGITMPKVPKVKMEGLNLAAQSLIHGNFLGLMPAKFADQFPGIKRATDADVSKKLEVWIIYHNTRKLDPIVRAGVQLIQESFA
jgi:DNA-binding transcriptional LysR family regulator